MKLAVHTTPQELTFSFYGYKKSQEANAGVPFTTSAFLLDLSMCAYLNISCEFNFFPFYFIYFWLF